MYFLISFLSKIK